VGRKLRRYLSKKSALSERREKEEIIRKLLPRISKKLAELLEREEPDINPVVAKIMGNLLVERSVVSENGESFVTLEVANYGDAAKAFKLHETVSVEAKAIEPAARVIALVDGYDHLWKVTLRPGEKQKIRYTVPSEGVSFSEPVVEGVPSELVSGARVVG
jgi:DNA topoisomerase-6 subunit B